MYPGLSKAIDSGQTVASFASPYLSLYAQELDLPTGSVDLNDPLVQRALQHQAPSTGSAAQGEPGVMPLWQFQRQLRDDPRWLNTTSARDSTLSTVHKVLTDFGLVT
jgi:hypothetical protein